MQQSVYFAVNKRILNKFRVVYAKNLDITSIPFFEFLYQISFEGKQSHSVFHTFIGFYPGPVSNRTIGVNLAVPNPVGAVS